MTTITIQKGQTLGGLAKQHHTSVETLAKLNQLKDPNKIIAGKKLIVSQDTFTAAKPAAKPQVAQAPQTATKPQVAPQQHGQTSGPAVTPRTVANPGDGFDAGSTQQTQTPQQTQAAVFSKNGRTFPQSNGYPLYSQNKTNGQHEPWAKLPMGDSNVGAIGCAMTAVTMGLSGISGQTITPDQSNKQVNKVGGFTSGGALEGKGWSSMGALTTPPVKVTRRPKDEIWTANRVDQELAAGRPVVMEVDYKVGPKGARRPGHDGKGDHWILVTGKTADGKYMANDPASGKQITLQRGANGKLETPQSMGGFSEYRTTGQVTTFDRGPAKRPATTTAPTQTQQPPLAQGGVQGSATQQPATKAPTQPSSTKVPQVSSGKVTAVDRKGNLVQPSPVLEKAIREASDKFGLDYGYMKAKAFQESTFKPENSASTTTAVGLYQFTGGTWLEMLKTHGAAHGLGDVAALIRDNPQAKTRFSVADPATNAKILNLRNDPRLNALMAGEYTRQNQKYLSDRGLKTGPVELYAAHFLGPGQSATFLKKLKAGQGGESAAALFPVAASKNEAIFYANGKKTGRELTVAEVYQKFHEIIVPNADAYNRTKVN